VMSPWAAVGLYGASHRMVMAALTFGLIFQQVVFPTLARSWRDTPEAGRLALDALVRVLASALIPLAVGTTLLAGPLVRWVLPPEYAGASLLLALGIWRAPLLTIAYLYQTALIALNREAASVRLLFAGAIGSGLLVTLLTWRLGLPGAAGGVVIVALALITAGYACLAREGRQPAWHHHLARPILASAAMAPACLYLTRWHVLAAVLGGAATYLLALAALGGLRRRDLLAILKPA